MPLGTEVGLGQGHIVYDGDPASPPMQRGTAAPTFRLMPIVARRSSISATAELLLPAALREAQNPCQISPPSVQRLGYRTPKLKV